MNIFTILLTQPLANGLVFFYKLLGQNMGLAILGLSLFLKLALAPLTRSSLENMKKMAELKPQLDKIKARHKNDKKKMMEAQSEFYKQKGFNPAGGCLPQILQLFVLYALFAVFNSVLKPGVDIAAKLNELLYTPLLFADGTIINTKFLYLDVVNPDVIKLAFLPFSIPGPLLILAAIAQMVSAKIAAPTIAKEEKIAKKTEDAADDFAVSMQKSSYIMFPLLTLVFGMSFPSGLALYWLLFSVFQAYQQYKTSGWGGLTPWLRRAHLLKS